MLRIFLSFALGVVAVAASLCCRGAPSFAAGGDAPFAELSDSENRALGKSGSRRGHVSGTFFHAIAAGYV